jgi:hypothetical protein
MKKKAQMQMMETIAILFIFFILVAFGFIFYANMLKGSVEITKRETSELRAVELAQTVSTMPELYCSEENVLETNCIDLLKIDTAAEVINNNYITYFDLFGYADISVEEVFPNNENYTIYSNKPSEYKARLPSYIPISLKDPLNKGYAFGIMTVVLYAR